MAGTNVVFVGNLAWPTTEETLRQFASSIGPVLSVQIQTHADTGRSKGWGLVRYSSPDLAARAIAELNGLELDGRKLHVREDRTYIESAQGVVVFVGNLPWSITTEALTELFGPYNPVDVHVKTNMAGRSRGFALVKFENADVAQQAILSLNNYEIEGRAIQVRFDRQQQGEGGSAPAAGMTERVAVNNLAWSTDEHELAAHMAQAGHVVGVEIQRHGDTGKSKGWAIVTYNTREEALQAINQLHKSVLRDRPIGLRFYAPGRR